LSRTDFSPGAKRSATIWGSITWTPFDARFKDIIDCMTRHRADVEAETTIMSAWMIKESKVSAEISKSEAKKMRAAAKIEQDLAREERVKAEKAREDAVQHAKQTEDMRKILEEQREGQ